MADYQTKSKGGKYYQTYKTTLGSFVLFDLQLLISKEWLGYEKYGWNCICMTSVM